jgi:hypothetical protein
MQSFMVAVLFNPFMSAGMSPDMAWLLAVLVPAASFVATAFRWVTSSAKRFADQRAGNYSSTWSFGVDAAGWSRARCLYLQCCHQCL